MSWFEFQPMLSTLISSWPSPDVIIIHLGDNDLEAHKTLDLISQIKIDFLNLHSIFPASVLIFSEIIP